MKDLTLEQYNKAKQYYWCDRYGEMLYIKFSIKPYRDYSSYTNDLTYDELNEYNKEVWKELQKEGRYF